LSHSSATPSSSADPIPESGSESDSNSSESSSEGDDDERDGRVQQLEAELASLRSEHTTAAEQSQRRLAEAITRRKQALEVAKLARKQATRSSRVNFARGLQASRAVSKQAKRAKQGGRDGKKARKGKERVKRVKRAARGHASGAPITARAAASDTARATASPHRTWQQGGGRAWPPPSQNRQWHRADA
jgi:hypothetical protein